MRVFALALPLLAPALATLPPAAEDDYFALSHVSL